MPLRILHILDGRVALDRRRLDGHERRVVAGEVSGVHDDAVHDARCPQSHDRPVVTAFVTAATSLPPVVHLSLVAEVLGIEQRSIGLDQVLALGEQLVVRCGDAAAERPRSQIGQRGEIGSGHEVPSKMCVVAKVRPTSCNNLAASRIEIRGSDSKSVSA